MFFFLKRARKKVGLALGSGAARGWAHIGVICAFQEEKIPIDFVAGSSIGALVGGFFCSGQLENLEKLALELSWRDVLAFFDLVFPKAGLIDGKKITDLLEKYIRTSKIEELDVPFCAVATDIVSGKDVVLKKGNVIDAIRASISIPGIFTPVKYDGQVLVDGGVANPVPVNVVKEMGAKVVFAVDLNASLVTPTLKKLEKVKESKTIKISKQNKVSKIDRFDLVQFKLKIKEIGLPQLKRWASKDPMPNIFEVILSSIYVMEQQITKYRLSVDKPDVVIEPDVKDIGFLEFHRADEAIVKGYKATMEKMEFIKKCAKV